MTAPERVTREIRCLLEFRVAPPGFDGGLRHFLRATGSDWGPRHMPTSLHEEAVRFDTAEEAREYLKGVNWDCEFSVARFEIETTFRRF